MNTWTFAIEKLNNGAWIVGWRQGHDDYGRLPADRAGFENYEDAEKFAIKTLRKLMRKQKEDWEKTELPQKISK